MTMTEEEVRFTRIRDRVFQDSQKRVYITSQKAADIWNERIENDRVKYPKDNYARYTRWSVYKRSQLPHIITPFGRLYPLDVIEACELHPHQARPDVAERNRQRATRHRKGE